MTNFLNIKKIRFDIFTKILKVTVGVVYFFRGGNPVKDF
jgi:hypothetical protein